MTWLESTISDSLRQQRWIRESARWLLTRFTTYRSSGQPDIVLLAARRSGSTWVMEMISSQPGMTFVNEPFLPELVGRRKLTTGLESLLPVHLRKILDVEPHAAASIRDHLCRFAATRIRGPYDFIGSNHSRHADRRVLKIVHATAIAEWIDDQGLGFQLVYLLRHPIPTALSMQRGCMLRAVANLVHPTFARRHLTKEQVSLAHAILLEGTILEQWVLEWCLDNLLPWRAVTESGRPWLVLTYEELVLAPARALQVSADYLRLRHPELLQAAATVPSASTDSARRDAIRGNDRMAQIGRWRTHVPPAQETRLMAIPETFGISLYETGSLLAQPRFLHDRGLSSVDRPRDHPAPSSAQQAS